jgi:FO synthase
MSVPEILEIAEAGRRAGALECLFTLGDRPESKYKEAREALTQMGFESTAAYLAHCAGAVLEKTGLLPHCNAGVVSRSELKRLREVSISQGLMLETSADRLVDDYGEAHFGCSSKRPNTRMKVIENAGALRIPFTSGILVGIGETRSERLDALFMIKASHLRYEHVQEILVQNFRAKIDTKMKDVPEPDLDELRWTVAVARLAFGSDMPIQCPPNLTPDSDDARAPREENAVSEDSRAFGWRALLDAGVSCFGGISPERVTPDHVSPELAWPNLDQLAFVTRDAGFALTPRLAAPPRFVLGREALETWVDAGKGGGDERRREVRVARRERRRVSVVRR